jgi:hypothetical protein
VILKLRGNDGFAQTLLLTALFFLGLVMQPVFLGRRYGAVNTVSLFSVAMTAFELLPTAAGAGVISTSFALTHTFHPWLNPVLTWFVPVFRAFYGFIDDGFRQRLF